MGDNDEYIVQFLQFPASRPSELHHIDPLLPYREYGMMARALASESRVSVYSIRYYLLMLLASRASPTPIALLLSSCGHTSNQRRDLTVTISNVL